MRFATRLTARRESSLAIDIHYESMKPVIIDGIKRQNAECKSNNELAGFWRTVKYLLSEGEIVNEGDFCIKTVTPLTRDIVTNADWPQSKRVLFLQKSRIFKLYKRSNKMTDEVGIPEASLKYYLEKSKEYLGEKKSDMKNIISITNLYTSEYATALFHTVFMEN